MGQPHCNTVPLLAPLKGSFECAQHRDSITLAYRLQPLCQAPTFRQQCLVDCMVALHAIIVIVDLQLTCAVLRA